MRDLFPWIRRVHERGVLDLITYVLLFIKRECATQCYVQYNPCCPHIYVTVPVSMGYHLWSCRRELEHTQNINPKLKQIL